MVDVDKNIGRLIGNYRVLAEIGSGGFGKVYQGEHIFLTERTVAIKFLHTHLSSAEEREQFLQEARFLEKLKHPYMLHVFDVGIDDGFPYLVIEYAPHKSLRNRMKQYAPGFIPAQEVLRILSQVGQALYYAHKQHIIHRDLKPENILFNAREDALLSDFGIATNLSTASVKAVGLIGTPLYMAPEQFQGLISKESDQYALGCIAYELVTGQPPFTAPDFFALGFKHLSATPVPPRQYNPSLPTHVEQAILKALAKQRHERHADIRAFIKALSIPASFQIQTPATPTTPFPPQNLVALDEEHPPIAPAAGFPGMTPHSSPQLSQQNDSDNTLTASYRNAQLVRYQNPVTPLPPVIQTPATGQGPVTPYPDVSDSGQWGGDAFPTVISASGAHDSMQEGTNAHFNSGKQAETASGFMATLPANTRNQGKFRSKRALILFATICILLLGSSIGVLAFAFSSTSSSPGITRSGSTASTTATAPGQAKGHPTQKPTQVGPSNPRATATHTPVSSPTVKPTSTSTTIIKQTPGPTSTPTTAIDPTPPPVSDPTPDPTPTPVTETLGVPFTSSGVTTSNSYSGQVTISLSGTGQASQTQYSDAFYVFTDKSGNSITPYHPSCWVLAINGQLATNFVSLPPYNSSHSYTFQIDVPAGQLTFNVCDGMHSDNTGSYSITVTQN